MSFAQDQGYVPATIEELMDEVMGGINTEFGTSYTTETFVGTNFYKYFYALIQLLQENEIRASEIVTKLQQYFISTNESLARPKTTSPGLLDALADAGYTASVKPMINADAGKVSVAVDVDSGATDYADTKLAINTIIKDCVPAASSRRERRPRRSRSRTIRASTLSSAFPTVTRTPQADDRAV
jgi:hypothetical protein